MAAAKKKRGPKVVTDAQKAAMAVGRAESLVVSTYLEARSDQAAVATRAR